MTVGWGWMEAEKRRAPLAGSPQSNSDDAGIYHNTEPAQAPRWKWFADGELEELRDRSCVTGVLGADLREWDQRRLCWFLAQHMQGKVVTMAGFEDLAGIGDPFLEARMEDMDALKPAVLEAYVRLGAEAFGKNSFEELWLAFLDAWGKVQIPGGDEALRVAFEHAQLRPVNLDLEAATDQLRAVAGTAYYLQLARPDEEIWLPRKQLGVLLRCSPAWVGTLVDILRRMGVLLPVNATYRYREGLCKTYRFNLSSPRYTPPVLHDGATVH